MSTSVWFAVIFIGLFFGGGLVMAAVVGLGFYLGWFGMKSGRANGKSYARFTLEENKILNDENSVVEAVRDLGHAGKDKVATPTQTMKDAAAPAV